MGEKELMKKVKEDAEGKFFLSDAQIKFLLDKVMDLVPLPEFLEDMIVIVLAKILRRIDGELYKLLPNEIYDLINHQEKGIGFSDSERMKGKVLLLLEPLKNVLFFLPEEVVEAILRIVIDLIFTAMMKGKVLA